MLIQPNAWTCYPTVVSYLTRIPYAKLIDALGHDGSRIVKPDEKPPKNRAAFEFSEMSLALLKLGWASVLVHASMENREEEFPDFVKLQEKLSAACDRIVVVAERLPGRYHAYGWVPSQEILLDPLTGDFLKTLPHSIPVANFECLYRIDATYPKLWSES